MANWQQNPLASDLDNILEHVAGTLEQLRGARLFITGGTGFFGCWLLESFIWANRKLKLGTRATVLTRDSGAFERKAAHLATDASVSLLCGDVRHFTFPEGKFDYVIHAATESASGLNERAPGEMLQAIVAGSQRTLELASGCDCEGILLTSSGAVYGSQPAEMTHIHEEYAGAPDPLQVASAYGEGKRMAELLGAIAYKNSGLPVKIARCFAFVGPYLPLDAHFAIGNFIRDGLQGGPIRVGGDGTPYRSYLYASDLMIWLWTILLRGQPGQAYNVGSEESRSIKAVAEAVSQSFSTAPAVKIAKMPDPTARPARYVPSTQRAQSELGLRQTVPLAGAIGKTIDWHRKISG